MGLGLICDRIIIIGNTIGAWPIHSRADLYRVYLRAANCVPTLPGIRIASSAHANGGLITCSPIDRMSTGRALVNFDDENHRSCRKRTVK